MSLADGSLTSCLDERGLVLMILQIELCVVAPLILSLSCHAGTRGINPKICDVFRDFALVSDGPAAFENDGSLDVTYIVPHNENGESLPAQLQTRGCILRRMRDSS